MSLVVCRMSTFLVIGISVAVLSFAALSLQCTVRLVYGAVPVHVPATGAGFSQRTVTFC
jgi:hypothetical protein